MWEELAVWVEEFPRPAGPDDDDGLPMPPSVPTGAEIRAQLRAVRTLFENVLKPPSPLDMRADLDAIVWWKKNLVKAKSPAINHLARIVHCIPATSAPSERVFSNSGLLATATRAALHADKVEMCTIIRGVMRTFSSAEEFAAVVQTHAAAAKVEQEKARSAQKRKNRPQPAANGAPAEPAPQEGHEAAQQQ